MHIASRTARCATVATASLGGRTPILSAIDSAGLQDGIGCELRFVASDTGVVYAALARHGITPETVPEWCGGGGGVREGGVLRFDAPPEELELISWELQQATQSRVTLAERSDAPESVQHYYTAHGSG